MIFNFIRYEYYDNDSNDDLYQHLNDGDDHDDHDRDENNDNGDDKKEDEASQYIHDDHCKAHNKEDVILV